jgi:hypothetical protein
MFAPSGQRSPAKTLFSGTAENRHAAIPRGSWSISALSQVLNLQWPDRNCHRPYAETKAS